MEIEAGIVAVVAKDAVPENVGMLVYVLRPYVGASVQAEGTKSGWWVVQSQGPMYTPDEGPSGHGVVMSRTRAGDTLIAHESNLLPLKSGPTGSVMRWQPRRALKQDVEMAAAPAKRTRKPRPSASAGS